MILFFNTDDLTRVATGGYGPGVIVGPGQHGPCQAGVVDSGPNNVTIQYNYVHATSGRVHLHRCEYVQTRPAGPGTRVRREWNDLWHGLQHGCRYLIQNNTIESCASWVGRERRHRREGRPPQLKGHRKHLPHKSGLHQLRTQQPGNDGQGPLFGAGFRSLAIISKRPAISASRSSPRGITLRTRRHADSETTFASTSTAG